MNCKKSKVKKLTDAENEKVLEFPFGVDPGLRIFESFKFLDSVNYMKYFQGHSEPE